MELLIFAHRGEAQAFLEEWEFSPVEFYFSGLFQNENYFLLICGEGMREASEKTVAVLTQFQKKIHKIFNIGIAGSLSEKAKKGSIHWVRSAYAHYEKKPDFKSFLTHYHTNIDCITTVNRIHSQDERKALSSFADLVDREFWAIASAGHLFKIETYGLKLVSDDSDQKEICQLIKEEAPFLSKTLLLEFKNKKTYRESLDKPLDNFSNYFFNHAHFYFTVSQKRKLTSLLKGVKLKKIMSEDELKNLAEKIIVNNSLKKNAKEISKILLEKLEEILFPMNMNIKTLLDSELAPFKMAEIDAQYDPNLEESSIRINHRIASVQDQKKLILALEQFNYKKIREIFKGNFGNDV